MKFYELISNLNPDNYEYLVNVSTKEELSKKVLTYLNEMPNFNDSIEVKIEWDGEGEYCLAAYSFGNPSVIKPHTVLETELEAYEFPIPLKLGLFTNTEEYIKNWKKQKGYNYIYLINHNNHVASPKVYTVEYVIMSNNEMDEKSLIGYLNEEKNIFIGEFNQLGANYFVEEIEDFDIDDILYYLDDKFDCESIKEIII